MTGPYEATLTADDLARGAPRRAKGCPVFLACERALGRALLGVRGDGTVVVRSRSDPYGADAVMEPHDARKVRDAVEAIDQGLAETVEPFTFPVWLPG